MPGESQGVIVAPDARDESQDADEHEYCPYGLGCCLESGLGQVVRLVVIIVVGSLWWLREPGVRFVLGELVDVVFQLSAEDALGLRTGVWQLVQEFFRGLQWGLAALGESDVGVPAVSSVLVRGSQDLAGGDHAAQAFVC